MRAAVAIGLVGLMISAAYGIYVIQGKQAGGEERVMFIDDGWTDAEVYMDSGYDAVWKDEYWEKYWYLGNALWPDFYEKWKRLYYNSTYWSHMYVDENINVSIELRVGTYFCSEMTDTHARYYTVFYITTCASSESTIRKVTYILNGTQAMKWGKVWDGGPLDVTGDPVYQERYLHTAYGEPYSVMLKRFNSKDVRWSVECTLIMDYYGSQPTKPLFVPVEVLVDTDNTVYRHVFNVTFTMERYRPEYPPPEVYVYRTEKGYRLSLTPEGVDYYIGTVNWKKETYVWVENLTLPEWADRVDVFYVVDGKPSYIRMVYRGTEVWPE